MPARTTRRVTNEEGKDKTRAYAPYRSSRQPSNSSQGEQGTLLRPPLAHKSSSSSSSGSTRGQRSLRVDLGMPTRKEFAALEEQYLESLDKRKKKKALISQDMFDKIWLTLHCPEDVTIETPQFRWWVRKMFALVHPCQLSDDVLPALDSRPSWQKDPDRHTMNFTQAEGVVVHDGKRVAVREYIYDILSVCHQRAQHSGRDKTSAEIKKTFTWIPKDLVALFVKHCPTCMHKKTGTFEEYVVEEQDPLPDVLPAAQPLASPVLCDSGIANVMTRYLPVPTNNVMMASRSDLAHSSSTRSLVPTDCGSLPPLQTMAFSVYPPGPGPVPHPSGDFHTSQSALPSHPSCWQVYPSTSACDLTPSNSVWPHVSEDGTFMPHGGKQHSFAQLPSIQVDRGLPPPGMYYNHPTKVTLPSFSEVCSGRLTVGEHPSLLPRPRQPLQALPHNIGMGPGGPVSLQVPSQHARFVPVQYAPPSPSHSGMVPIDPALLFPGDGVRMLALAAEAHQLEGFADENARM